MKKFLTKILYNRKTWMVTSGILCMVVGSGMILGVTFPTWYLILCIVYAVGVVAIYIKTEVDIREKRRRSKGK